VEKERHISWKCPQMLLLFLAQIDRYPFMCKDNVRFLISSIKTLPYPIHLEVHLYLLSLPLKTPTPQTVNHRYPLFKEK